MPSTIRFGTDGWRAIIGEDYTFENVRACGQAVATYLKDTGKASKGLVVGYDTRFGSADFAAAVSEVVAGNGIKVYLCQSFAPTPTISYGILEKGAAGAAVITASHNPARYNGFKYKPEYAGSASPQVIAALEERLDAIAADELDIWSIPLEEGLERGLIERFDPRPAYLKKIEELADLSTIKGAGLRIVVDPMYGAGMGYFPQILAGGRTQVVEIHGSVNPAFPGIRNPEPIALNLTELGEELVRQGATVGLATDGDADRLGVMDEKGQFITQLQVCALLLLYLLEVRSERGPIVRTVTGTKMADRLAQLYGLPLYETPVGFKYVGPRMMETGAIFGGEESGGYGFRGHIPERDGILSGLYFLELMAKMEKSPGELVEYLYQKVGPHHYDRIDKHFPLEQREAIITRLRASQPAQVAGVAVERTNTKDGFKYELVDGSWLLVRFSGTEPILRIEGEAATRERGGELLSQGERMTGLGGN